MDIGTIMRLRKEHDKQLNNLHCYPHTIFCLFCRNSPQWGMASFFTKFLDHTQRRTTVGGNPLDEGSARHRDLYLTTHSTHNRETSMPPGRIRTHNLSRRAAADLRLRQRGQWDRPCHFRKMK
jgi:hypothetical protein